MDIDIAQSTTKWLLTHSNYDTILATALTTFLLTSRILYRYSPIYDNIPDTFWSYVPQQKSLTTSEQLPQDQESRNIKHTFSNQNLDMVVFWGSQSGRGEMLARRLAKHFHDRFGLRTLAADLDEYDHNHLTELQTHQLCAFVLSTYGDGDPPDNTNGLWSVLQRFQAEHTYLKNLRYILFGLGNSQYRQYNRVARHFDSVLQNLGAVRYGPAGQGDDAQGGTESDYLSWRSLTERRLREELGLSERESTYNPAFRIDEMSCIVGPEQLHLGVPHSQYSSHHRRTDTKGPQPLLITRIEKLWEDTSRLCIQANLDLGENRQVKYKTGDHLAIWPSNPDHEVDKLLSLLGLTEKRDVPIHIEATTPQSGSGSGNKISVPSPTTIEALFRYYLEICGIVSPETLSDLAKFTKSKAAQTQLLHISQNPDVFRDEVLNPQLTLADVLQTVGWEAGSVLPLSFLLERCKPMRPRYYSISSSAIVVPRTVSIIAVVNKPPLTDNCNVSTLRGCHGLATSHLHALETSINHAKSDSETKIPSFCLSGPSGMLTGGKIFSSVNPSTFKLPIRGSTPIIMIGAGTGVAPFCGFVQERVQRKHLGQEIGKTLLFMGFRKPEVDFIGGNDWNEWREVLGSDVFKFHLAFSRSDDAGRKVYVQDRICENADEVMDMLDGDGACRLYICGSARMARDVVTALVSIQMARMKDDEQKARAWIKQLRDSKRLLEDVWG